MKGLSDTPNSRVIQTKRLTGYVYPPGLELSVLDFTVIKREIVRHINSTELKGSIKQVYRYLCLTKYGDIPPRNLKSNRCLP